MTIRIKQLDQLVLTVSDLRITCEFYVNALGMEKQESGNGRIALHFGDQTIYLRQKDSENAAEPHAHTGSTPDLRFICESPVEVIYNYLTALGIEPVSGVVERPGVNGPMRSLYLRDPDGNLIELSNRIATK